MDADLAFLLARYGRLRASELAVVNLVVQSTEATGRSFVRMSPGAATADAPALFDYLGVGRSRASRILNDLLRAPEKRRENRPGHRVLVRMTSRAGGLLVALNDDWRRWGWRSGTDLDQLEADRRRLVPPMPRGSWSPQAEELAADLAARVSGAPPSADTSDPVFRRWCRSTQRLLDAAGMETVRAAYLAASSDPYWAHRIAGCDADRHLAALWPLLTSSSRRRAA